jgi:hypothetical protein
LLPLSAPEGGKARHCIKCRTAASLGLLCVSKRFLSSNQPKINDRTPRNFAPFQNLLPYAWFWVNPNGIDRQLQVN